MKKIIFLIFSFLIFAFFLNGCGHSIDANYETISAKNIELTDGSETLAKITAAKDTEGKVVVTVKDKNGNLIGTISTK